MTPHTRHRTNDPTTSRHAAERSLTFSESHAGRILKALDTLKFAGADDIAETTGLSVVQVLRRTKELQQTGQIRVVSNDGEDSVFNGYRVWEVCSDPQPVKPVLEMITFDGARFY